MARSTTITREQARILNATNEFVPLPGWVKIPGGFVSSHDAFVRTLADPTFPETNALAVAAEQHAALAPQRAAIAKAEAQVAADKAAARKESERQNAAWKDREARQKAAYAKQSGVNLV